MANDSEPKKLFAHLKREVVEPGFCVGCGACVVSCPLNSIEFVESSPDLQGKCTVCGLCYEQCPQIVSDDILRDRIYEESDSSDIGHYEEAYAGKTTSPEIEVIAQNGGMVTSLLVSLLERDFIDGAIVMDKDSEWKPIPKVATNKEDLLDSAGTKYSPAPGLTALGDAVNRYNLNRIALVGTPCQIKAIRNMSIGDRPAKKFSKNVILTIGLFCLRSFDYESLFEEVLPEELEIDPTEVTKFDVTKDGFIIYRKGSPKRTISLDVMEKFVPEACKLCDDFTAELADISVGSMGSPEGFSTTLLRTDIGKRAFSIGLKEDAYEVRNLDSDGPGLSSIRDLSRIKKQKVERRIKIKQRNEESLPSGLSS